MTYGDQSATAPDVLNPLSEVSEYRDDRLLITFHQIADYPHRFSVRLAGGWTGLVLNRQIADGEVFWWVRGMPQLGRFRVRGEAVAAAIVTTFDPDN